MSIRRAMHERVRWVGIGLGGIIYRKKGPANEWQKAGAGRLRELPLSSSTMVITSTPSNDGTAYA